MKKSQNQKEKVIIMTELKNDWPWIWMLVITGYFLITGLLTAIFPESLDYAMEINYDTIVGENLFQNRPSEEVSFHNWVVSSLGVLQIGWFFVVLFVVWYGFRIWIKNDYSKHLNWTWTCLVVSMTIWFILDFLFALNHQLWGHIITLGIGFIIYMVPFIYVFPQCRKERESIPI